MNTRSESSEKVRIRRVEGLDTLRFVLTLWVVFRHLGFVPLPARYGSASVEQNSKSLKFLILLYHNLFSGQNAVIVFFLISGFCIHFPYRHHRQMVLLPYFLRRHIRIWIPLSLALIMAYEIGQPYSFFGESVLWSLLAEEIYYLLYPILLSVRRRFGWAKLLGVAYLLAAVILLRNPNLRDYPQNGPFLTWLLGLPCWLLGCVLAERVDVLLSPQQSLLPSQNERLEHSIWYWRLGAWVISSMCSILKFHAPVLFGTGYPWTLTFFAIYAFFWLQQEVQYFHRCPPKALWEKLGQGSYSIYLLHPLGPAIYTCLSLPKLLGVSGWLLNVAFTLAFCFLFYFLIERPSHNLARRVATLLAPGQAVPITSAY